jgi:hypothetical protein
VAHDLAGLVTRFPEAESVHDVIEAGFEEANEVLAGDTGTADRFFIIAYKLAFEHAIADTGALLFAELEAAVADFAAARRAGARGVGPPFEAALRRKAAIGLEIELFAVAPAEPAYRTGVPCHMSPLAC